MAHGTNTKLRQAQKREEAERRQLLYNKLTHEEKYIKAKGLKEQNKLFEQALEAGIKDVDKWDYHLNLGGD